jgi:hypothetical protein
LISAAPGILDTLNALTAALGNDPNFATTITTLISEKLAIAANLSDLADEAAARTNLGLGSAAVANTSAFDAAGTATAEGVLRAAADALKVDIIAHGSTVGTTSFGSTLDFTYTSVWGVDGVGVPYYDPAGAVDSEKAMLMVDSDGSVHVVVVGG